MTGRRTGEPVSERAGDARLAPRRPRGAMGHGVGAFVREDGGSTTLACAAAMLASLALVFCLANVTWVNSRSADVQAVADAGALAGQNVLSRYMTAAQLIDALVLSLGLVGMATMAIGLVLCAIPLVQAVGPTVVDAANGVLTARSKLSRSAAQGLSKVEAALPYLMAANSLATVRANAGDSGSYVGIAIPFPLESESDFGLLDQDDISEKMRELKDSGDEIDRIEGQAVEAKEQADEAKERGWVADCGGAVSMRERAETLAGLGGALNPHYPSSAGWDFSVPIRRASAYYQARVASEAVATGGGVDEMNRSSARLAFYEYALEQVSQSTYVENGDGTVECELRELPSNTDGVRATTLYTDVRWPCTVEGGSTVLHSSWACPGATGSRAGEASLAMQEQGLVGVCTVCGFTVTDLGRTPSASTNIDNGFEHYWREVVRASEDYEQKRDEQAELESQAQRQAELASESFSDAIEQVKAVRVSLAPPGRFGCVCVVADARTHLSPTELSAFVGSSARMPARVAISGAVLAKDPATKGNTVLAGFFDGVVASGNFGAGAGVLDTVMSAWGDLLVSYGDAYTAFSNQVDSAFRRLEDLGMGRVASWLRGAISGVVDLAAMEPADLSARKPVLVDTNSVVSGAGNDWYSTTRAFVLAIQSVGGDASPSAILSALGIFEQALTGDDSIRVAELTIPGTDLTVPIDLDLGWLADVTKGAA